MLPNILRLVRRTMDMIRLPILTCCLIHCGVTIYAAPSVTLDFSEIPFQSVDGLTYAGITFDFRIGGVHSTEAFYNSFGPGTLTYVDDPSLTGDSAGVLTLDFAVPTSVLEFGLALNTASQLTPGFRVELLAPDLMSLGETSVDVFPNAGALGFSENRFEYMGVPVARAVIRANYQPGSFAIDNLTFLPVPEPPTIWLFTLTAIGWCICRGNVIRKAPT